MPDFIPIDEFVSDEWYPGFSSSEAGAPWIAEGLSTFQPGDEQRFWLLDFHYPRGMVPLGYIFPEDGICWGTQLAAETLPLPPSRGLAARMAGPHIYSGQVDVTSPWELRSRAARISRNLPGFLEQFPKIWADRVVELERGLAHFEDDEHALESPAEIGAYFADAQAFFKRAWEIHFEMMYPLLAAYVGFYGLCQQLGLDPSEISRFLQGEDSKIMEVDRQLWELTAAARRAGLTRAVRGDAGRGPARPPSRPAPISTARVGCSPSTTSWRPTATAPKGSPTSSCRRGGRTARPRSGRSRPSCRSPTTTTSPSLASSRSPSATRPSRAPAASWRATNGNSSTRPSPAAPPPTSRGGTRSTTTTSTCAPTSRCAGRRWPWPPPEGAATRPTGCSCSARSSRR